MNIYTPRVKKLTICIWVSKLYFQGADEKNLRKKHFFCLLFFLFQTGFIRKNSIFWLCKNRNNPLSNESSKKYTTLSISSLATLVKFTVCFSRYSSCFLCLPFTFYCFVLRRENYDDQNSCHDRAHYYWDLQAGKLPLAAVLLRDKLPQLKFAFIRVLRNYELLWLFFIATAMRCRMKLPCKFAARKTRR